MKKIPNKSILYIKETYNLYPAKNIAEQLNLTSQQVREIAKLIGVTKRKFSETTFPNDKWCDIIHPTMSFSKYEISDNGHFRRKNDHVVIQWAYGVDGRPTIKLVNDDGKRVINKVSRMMGFTFHQLDDSSLYNILEVDHINGDILNNNYKNLEWVTSSENQRRSYALGLRKPANMTCDLKDIELVCELMARGFSNREIKNMVDFNITKNSLSNIRRKRTYKKISNKYF